MKTTAYYSGKIETKNRECFVGNQKVDCPGSQEKNSTQTGDKLDILPPSPILDKRGDFVFTSIILLVVIGYILLAVFKTRVFGKTLAEYVKPVWYFILISILIVLWRSEEHTSELQSHLN